MKIASRSRVVLTLATIAMLGFAVAAFAPYLDAEYMFDFHGSKPSPLRRSAAPVTGRWFDDYFVIETLDSTTFAIGEPLYYQGNYSYLILGSRRGVLFDAGSGLRDIVPVVRSLTNLPVTVVASHLHFDHVGALGRLTKTAMIDEPSLHGRVRDSRLTLRRYEFLGFADRLPRPTFRVDEWWDPDSTIDLGERRLQVLATPGHTPTSVSLYDVDRHQLFAGDFIYPGHLYAFLPGASRSEYRTTTQRLLSSIAPHTVIYAAHMEDASLAVKAPVLEIADLQALAHTLAAIDQNAIASSGFYPRVFPVRGAIEFATGWAWNNR